MNMILTCSCNHVEQDKYYGHRRRVHNPTKKSQGEKTVYRCTICGKERTGK